MSTGPGLSIPRAPACISPLTAAFQWQGAAGAELHSPQLRASEIKDALIQNQNIIAGF